jgi:hypothetical protein
MKKFFAIAIIAASLTACGGETKTEETTVDTTAAAALDTAAAALDTAAAALDTAAAKVDTAAKAVEVKKP